jgi:transposase-like protein
MENKKPRRKLSSQFKTQLVMEYLRGVKSQAEICRENAITPSLFTKWCRQFQERVPSIFDDSQKNNQAEQMAKLEQIVGRQAIEIDFLKRGLRMFGH